MRVQIQYHHQVNSKFIVQKKRYKLNEYGIFNSKNNEKVRINEDIDINIKEEKLLDYIEKVEREVFKFAGMEYKNVKERY